MYLHTRSLFLLGAVCAALILPGPARCGDPEPVRILREKIDCHIEQALIGRALIDLGLQENYLPGSHEDLVGLLVEKEHSTHYPAGHQKGDIRLDSTGRIYCAWHGSGGSIAAQDLKRTFHALCFHQQERLAKTVEEYNAGTNRSAETLSPEVWRHVTEAWNVAAPPEDPGAGKWSHGNYRLTHESPNGVSCTTHGHPEQRGWLDAVGPIIEEVSTLGGSTSGGTGDGGGILGQGGR